MQKIGETSSGSIIVELSKDEWDNVLILKAPVFSSKLEEWSNQFRKDFDEGLELSTRTHNALLRGLHVWNTDDEDRLVEPYIFDPQNFSIDGRYLTFYEWCDAVLDGKITIMTNNFGNVSASELKQKLLDRRIRMHGDNL